MSKITESARGEECQVRLPAICNFDPSTTVFAHINGAGVALKALDFQGAYCCSKCHSVVDGHTRCGYDYDRYFLEGVIRTQVILYRKGLLLIKGEENGRKRKNRGLK